MSVHTDSQARVVLPNPRNIVGEPEFDEAEPSFLKSRELVLESMPRVHAKRGGGDPDVM